MHRVSVVVVVVAAAAAKSPARGLESAAGNLLDR
jgi:hypothetical protein